MEAQAGGGGGGGGGKSALRGMLGKKAAAAPTPLQQLAEVCEERVGAACAMAQGELASLMCRRQVEAIVLATLHQRDSVTRMLEYGVQGTQNFAWKSTLRFYWDDDRAAEAVAAAAAAATSFFEDKSAQE